MKKICPYCQERPIVKKKTCGNYLCQYYHRIIIGRRSWKKYSHLYNKKHRLSLSRKANKVWVENNPEKYKAHQLLSKALKEGKITRPNKCVKCGKESKNIIGHHNDYNKPLEVEWVCKTCHRRLYHNPEWLREFDSVNRV